MEVGKGNGQRALLRGLEDLPGTLHPSVPLAPHTTFRIGGPAWVLFQPHDLGALTEAVARADALGVPWRILGGGSNVLFSDRGFPGLVISTGRLASCSREEGLLVAEAGFPLARLVGSGFSFLAGIPGTVGGGVVMNAGTRFGQLGDQVEWVEVLLPDGEVVRWGRQECGFSYRDSRLHRLGLPVLRAALRPKTGPPPAEVLAHRRATQPLDQPSAGCVFRNPPQAPAGWLIDRAGLKGARQGDAMVSPRHANFIVNTGRARASDVLTLVDRVRQQVLKRFGVWLQLELDVVTT
ncbi:TPA: UDP-N-acetylenolpyruvoylglucosamine reductase [Candidatus Acetothermia bacterium]|nr:UDP-N-acetylenolpyruvoylglucosamine reductase [Candidatus Acetothermia bacterium]